jgi:hypothetical protein
VESICLENQGLTSNQPSACLKTVDISTCGSLSVLRRQKPDEEEFWSKSNSVAPFWRTCLLAYRGTFRMASVLMVV